jgi:hypothetical protein
VGILGPSLEVQQVEERPARLGNGRIELQRVFPAALGQVIPLPLVVGLPTEKRTTAASWRVRVRIRPR